MASACKLPNHDFMLVLESNGMMWEGLIETEQILYEAVGSRGGWQWSQNNQLVVVNQGNSLLLFHQKDNLIQKISAEENYSGIRISPNGQYISYQTRCSDSFCYKILDAVSSKVIWNSASLSTKKQVLLHSWSPNSQYIIVSGLNENFSSRYFALDIFSGNIIKVDIPDTGVWVP